MPITESQKESLSPININDKTPQRSMTVLHQRRHTPQNFGDEVAFITCNQGHKPWYCKNKRLRQLPSTAKDHASKETG